jgi:hypothetical protein
MSLMDTRKLMRELPALSIRQPWAWLIVHEGKDVENRAWRTPFRGRVLIHAAKGMGDEEFDDAMIFAGLRAIEVREPARAELQFGGIVGVATIVDCVTQSRSPWFTGPWGFVLEDVEPVPFVRCRGMLGFFTAKEAA